MSTSSSVQQIPDTNDTCILVFECEYSEAAKSVIDLIDTLSSRTGNPIVYVASHTDGTKASEALRVGASGYFPLDDYADPDNELNEWLQEFLANHSKVGNDYEDNNFVSTIRDISQAIAASNSDFETLINRLLKIGENILDSEASVLSHIDGNQYEFEVLRSSGLPLDAGDVYSLEDTYCKRTVSDKQTTALPDVERDAPDLATLGAYTDLGLVSYLGVPVEVNGDIYGTFCYFDTNPRDEYTAQEIVLVELLGAVAETTIQRRQYEREIKTARDEVEDILARIQDGFFAVDNNWDFTYVNQTAAELLERPAGELVGTNVWDEFPEAIQDAFYDEYHRAMDEQMPVSFEEYFAPLDIWFEVSAYPSPDGLSVYFSNVTERKRYERVLSGLLETSQATQQLTEKSALAERVVDDIQTVLGFDASAVYLQGDSDNLLKKTAGSKNLSDDIEEMMQSVAVSSFSEINQTKVVNTTTDKSKESYAVLAVPLADYGLIIIKSDSETPFTSNDIRVSELLGTTVSSALERIERQHEITRYANILETVEGMVWTVDGSGIFTLVTEPLARLLGYTVDEMIGTSFERYIQDEDILPIREMANEIRQDPTQSSQQYQTVAITADGDEIPLEIELSTFDEHSNDQEIVGIAQNISTLRAKEQQIKQERERFRYLFEHLPDPAVELEYCDNRIQIQTANNAYTDLVQTSEKDMKGEKIESMTNTLIPGDPNTFSPSTIMTQEITETTKSGRKHFLCHQIPYSISGRSRSFRIYTDITGIKRREEQLTVLHRLLRHNLRNELTAITGFAEVMMDQLEEPHREYARRVYNSGSELQELSETAKRIAETITDDPAPMDPINLTSVLSTIISKLENEFPTAVIDINFSEDVYVLADDRLDIVFEELIDNALRYVNTGNPYTEINLNQTNGAVEVEIADNGPGIDPVEWEVVTREREVTQLSHGSGLGLWLVTWLIEDYAGELDYTSTENGSIVTVRLQTTAADSFEKTSY
ncbi:PAS domain S-box protein [Salinarchaeum sp. IM2453]|uniref:sensor histidine kinase n=1 Tax=Salinarchaeum sp. IM2453 TaxID=2862870 RepID=UPI001C83FBF5|nr:PAS domain S-box protein [Salinarchaeum sp. IM2453]QZA88126.1 PAS domain S-box protein [Salinarchaeum sp. IM2453]